MRQYLSLFLIILLINACKKEDGAYDASLNIKKIQGVECRNETGDIYAIVGSPDIRLKDKDTGPYSYSIFTFSNPNYSFYYSTPHFYEHMVVFIESYLPVSYAHLWVERARYFDNPSSTVNYAGAAFIKANEHVIDKDSLGVIEGHNQLHFYVKDLTPGYYRLYLQINDELLWDNLAINFNPL